LQCSSSGTFSRWTSPRTARPRCSRWSRHPSPIRTLLSRCQWWHLRRGPHVHWRLRPKPILTVVKLHRSSEIIYRVRQKITRTFFSK
jgi:hypothetical protein